MGVLAKLLGAHGVNVAATLAAVYLSGRTALPARWLSGISVYRAGAATRKSDDGDDERDGGDDEILLGGAETVAQLRLTEAAVAASAFFDEWSALATALAVLLANAAADAARAAALAFSSPSSSTSPAHLLWQGTFYSSLWAVLAALYTLVKVEVDQARVLSAWAQLREAAVVGAGATGVALLVLLSSSSSSSSSSPSSSSSSSPLLPALDLAAGGKAAARLLYVATEIEVETVPDFFVALPLAAVAGAFVPLLAGSAARAARAVSLSAARAPRWGREMLLAGSLRDRAALRCAALVAPLAAALFWLEPCARLWVSPPSFSHSSKSGKTLETDTAFAVDALRSLSLVFAALSAALAARPSVAAHCGTALVVWWTRKHGFVSRRRGRGSGGRAGGGGGGGGGGSGGETGASASAAASAGSAAARRRAGEVLRLSMQFVNLFALKAGVQALAPALLWLGCAAVSLAPALAGAAAAGTAGGGGGGGGGGDGGGSGGGGSKQVALWLGGWSAAVFSLCSLWHLTLYWCGWLTDVPSGGKR